LVTDNLFKIKFAFLMIFFFEQDKIKKLNIQK